MVYEIMSYHTTNIRFEQMQFTGIRCSPCPVCNKKAQRQKTFHMTVSPFNKNPDGSVRTRQEVFIAVRDKALEWGKSPAYHTKCEPE